MRLKDIQFYLYNDIDDDYGYLFYMHNGTQVEMQCHEGLHKMMMNNKHIIKVYDVNGTMETHEGLLTIPI